MREDAALCVLAGGEGARMGQAKASLRVDDAPILSFLLDRLDWPGETLLVTAPGREHPPGCERFDREVSDPVRGQGPLRGLLTALEHVQSSIAVVVSVDMPLIGRRQLKFLVESLAGNLFGVMTRRVTPPMKHGGEHVEPFPSAFRRDAITLVRNRMNSPRRSVTGLAFEPGFRAIDAPIDWPAQVWTNLNTPTDFAAFIAGFTAGRKA